MAEEKQPIIIKRVKKVAGGHHGGAWKVAFADFMTAMMSFFLVMWLVATMVPTEKRVEVAGYFKFKPILFPNGNSVLDERSTVKKGLQFRKPPAESRGVYTQNPDDLRDKLKTLVENELAAFAENISVRMTEQGIRVDVADSPASRIFPKDESGIGEGTGRILGALSKVLAAGNNKLVIESYVNSAAPQPWETTTARALACRNALVESGIDPERVAKVSGCGNSRSFIDSDSQDVRNNRISLVVMFAPVL